MGWGKKWKLGILEVRIRLSNNGQKCETSEPETVNTTVKIDELGQGQRPIASRETIFLLMKSLKPSTLLTGVTQGQYLLDKT